MNTEWPKDTKRKTERYQRKCIMKGKLDTGDTKENWIQVIQRKTGYRSYKGKLDTDHTKENWI